MESGMVIIRNWAVALASTFALWSATPSVAGAAVPGSGIRSAIQNVAVQSNPVTNVRQGYCGPMCFTGRNFNRGPQSRSRVRTGQTPRRFQGHRHGDAAAVARRNGRPVYASRKGARNAYRYRSPRNQVAFVYRRGKSARSNFYYSKSRAYRINKNRGRRSYRNYGHYKKHCHRNCARYRERNRRYSHYHRGWWYSRPWRSLSVPIYAYAQNDDQYDDLPVAFSSSVRGCRILVSRLVHSSVLPVNSDYAPRLASLPECGSTGQNRRLMPGRENRHLLDRHPLE